MGLLFTLPSNHRSDLHEVLGIYIVQLNETERNTCHYITLLQTFAVIVLVIERKQAKTLLYYGYVVTNNRGCYLNVCFWHDYLPMTCSIRRINFGMIYILVCLYIFVFLTIPLVVLQTLSLTLYWYCQIRRISIQYYYHTLWTIKPMCHSVASPENGCASHNALTWSRIVIDHASACIYHALYIEGTLLTSRGHGNVCQRFMTKWNWHSIHAEIKPYWSSFNTTQSFPNAIFPGELYTPTQRQVTKLIRNVIYCPQKSRRLP